MLLAVVPRAAFSLCRRCRSYAPVHLKQCSDATLDGLVTPACETINRPFHLWQRHHQIFLRLRSRSLLLQPSLKWRQYRVHTSSQHKTFVLTPLCAPPAPVRVHPTHRFAQGRSRPDSPLNYAANDSTFVRNKYCSSGFGSDMLKPSSTANLRRPTTNNQYVGP